MFSSISRRLRPAAALAGRVQPGAVFGAPLRQFAPGPLDETELSQLNPKDFVDALASRRVNFFAGVPDSLLKDLLNYVADNVPKENHVITANEGTAVALAAGYHMASGRTPMVYLQNSGLGNTVNPLLSLCDSKVYSMPMLLLVGWRGEPGHRDEPQHQVQGAITPAMLSAMNVNYEVLPDYQEGMEKTLDTAMHYVKTRKAPYALLVRKNTFVPTKLQQMPNRFEVSREQAIELVLNQLGKFDVCVGTTGFTSRELYELRAKRGEGHERDFLCVGSMGHASNIALGIAMGKPSRNVYCFDGDGAMLMHMGGVATVGIISPPNLKHIVFNNEAHESVGGQATGAETLSLTGIAQACGYAKTLRATSPEEIVAATKELAATEGPALLEIMVNKGARSDLGRPKSSPVENKQAFMNFLDA